MYETMNFDEEMVGLKSRIYIDYEGQLPQEDDPADYVEIVKAVRIA